MNICFPFAVFIKDLKFSCATSQIFISTNRHSYFELETQILFGPSPGAVYDIF